MTLLTQARSGDQDAFGALVEPHRRELQVHCYRILGSVQDAEDLVQEALLAAWRGLDNFDARSSLRTWLYKIATNRCLNHLRDIERRPPQLGAGLVAPTRVGEPLWLEPYPDELLAGLADDAPGPEARLELREGVALAFVTGLQHLPPQQRAVLVLRDVLGFRAGEVAEMLESSEAAVTSALQRARATLETRSGSVTAGRLRERAPLPDSATERALLARFVEAFESHDVPSLVELLTDDAVLTMPPQPAEWHGREAIGAFLDERFSGRGERRGQLIATRANGQPAFVYYARDASSPVRRYLGVFVLTLEGDQIVALTRFGDTAILPFFGLPLTLP
jgi:RNA polymerase sigma-70 factor (TIGR02960 family)